MKTDMNRIGTFVALALLIVSASSCDFFRVVAGRPTSKEIENKRLAIETALKEKQAVEESLKDTLESVIAEVEESGSTVEQQAVQDSSIDADEIIRSNGIKLSGSSLISSSSRELVTGRYVIVIGAFGSPANAEAQAARARELEYDTVLIPYTNGLIAVGVCPCDGLSQACDALLRLRKEAFCPPEAWILDKTLQ